MWEQRGEGVFFCRSFSAVCSRSNECNKTFLFPQGAIFFLNYQHADTLIRRLTCDLDSRHGFKPRTTQFVWVRPVNVDAGLKVVFWTSGLGGWPLPAAWFALHPREKKLCFGIGERSGEVEVFYGRDREKWICFALCSVDPTSKQTPPACMVDTNHKLQNCSPVPVVWLECRCDVLLAIPLCSLNSTVYQVQVVHLFSLSTRK